MVPEAAVAGTITHFRERCDDSTDQPCARDRGSSVVQHRYAAIARCAARPGGGDRDVPDAVSRLRPSRLAEAGRTPGNLHPYAVIGVRPPTPFAPSDKERRASCRGKEGSTQGDPV